MKKILIGTLVGTILFFLYQTTMWMGGIHGNFANYTTKQNEIISALSQNLDSEGLYLIPMADPGSPNKVQEEENLMKNHTGKPWAMIFYHPSLDGMSMSYILVGILYSLIACLITSLILFYGNFSGFQARFLVSMAFAVFTLAQGVLDDMNWWSYPWSFVKTEVLDLTLGWAMVSVWFAWFFKK